MASIRRTLSPVPRPGALINGEAVSVASPLSKSSSFTQQSSGVLPSAFGSLDYALYKAQTSLFSFLSQRSSRSTFKAQIWRRTLFRFFICFIIGVFIGFTPFASLDPSTNLMSKNQAFSFEVVHPVEQIRLRVQTNDTSQAEITPELNLTINQDLHIDMKFHKHLIIVTPTQTGPSQAYHLNRVAQTLKLVPPPLLWLVVEMTSQSVQTADLLRRTGVMYRHLVCTKNLSEIKDKNVHLRNTALSHIEKHRLDGLIYFADEDKIFSTDLFQQIRQIRRFGTFIVAKLRKNQKKVSLEGPICNGTQVIGWHTDDITKRFRRFHAEISGFAFNSTILWDPLRWHRRITQPIRQLDTVKKGFQVSSFIEQLVEDESQMEGFPVECSKVMVWQFDQEKLDLYPNQWFKRNQSVIITPLA